MASSQVSSEAPVTSVTEVPFSEAHKYLAPFFGNYSGYGRQGSVKVTDVELLEAGANMAITVEARDPELGRYRLNFREARIQRDPAGEFEEPYLGDPDSNEIDDDVDDPVTFMDPDKVRGRSQARLERLLGHGDWSVHDGFDRYYGTIRPVRGWPRGGYPGEEERAVLEEQMLADLEQNRSVILHLSSRNFMGYTTMEIVAEELVIERLDVERAKGTCLGCGGATFVLTCQAGLTVESAEDGSLGVDATVATPGDLVEMVSLRNVLVSVHCSSCGLEHPQVDMGSFTGVVRGLGWNGKRRGIAASTGRLGHLLDTCK